MLYLSMLVLLWFVLESACYGTLFALGRKGVYYAPLVSRELSGPQQNAIRELLEARTSYTIHHSVLGWSIKPNGKATIYRANSQGLRGDEDYSLFRKDGVLRIETFGDSFTHGDEVDNSHTWQAYLEQLYPRYQVMNFGVGGYGPDQSFLRYKNEGRQFHPDCVLIGFMSENLARTVNVFRPFYSAATRLPLSKPRFVFERERLRLLDNPLPSLEQYHALLATPLPVLERLGEKDWFYQHRYRAGALDVLPSIRLAKVIMYKSVEDRELSYGHEAEAFRLSVEIIARFYNEVQGDSSVPVVLLFPGKNDMEDRLNDRTPPYESLKAALKERQVALIDLMGAFDCEELSDHFEEYFQENGHYSPKANALVAQFMGIQLDRVLGRGVHVEGQGPRSCGALRRVS